jgi:hypothetical protein
MMAKTLKSIVRPCDAPRWTWIVLALPYPLEVAQTIRPYWWALVAHMTTAIIIMAKAQFCSVQCCTLFSGRG